MLLAAAGCPAAPDGGRGSDAANPTTPRASVTLRVAVVSDEPLRRAVDRLRGEWRERSDGQVEIIDLAGDSDLVAAAGGVDLVVFPSRALGVLCEAGALRPVRPSVLRSPELRFDDFLPLVREAEVVYAQQVFALPIGCPTPLCLAREEEPPRGLALPADDAELALVYLAWAAPHAVHRSRTTTLFDSDDFAPRLARPPFVRALESLVGSAGEGPASVGWPARGEALPAGLSPRPIPGADENFDPIAEVWAPLPPAERGATLVASRGALLAVTASSRNAATAFRYAAWLAGPQNARQLSIASDRVANCRGSLARSADPWRNDAGPDAGKRFAELTAEALRAPRFLLAPRLPGAEEYLAALGKQVREAFSGKPAAEALAAAAEAWEALSRARGRDAQRAAYDRSINAAPFAAGRR